MKTRYWKNGKLKIVEKVIDDEKYYDVKIKRHHMWITTLRGVRGNHIKQKYGLDTEPEKKSLIIANKELQKQ